MSRIADAWQAIQIEAPPMYRLALPVVIAELGWVAMALVDTMVVGRVSPAAMGAVAIGGILFHTVAMAGLGILLALDTLVSQAFGSGDIADCHHSLLNAIYLAVPLSALSMGLVWLFKPLLQSFGIDPAVLREALPYLDAVTWSTFPLLLYFAFRRYLQGMNLVRPVMFALISANLLNFAGDWILVFGYFGFPAMGTSGAGWATSVSRIYMAAVLIAYALYYDRRNHTGLLRTPLKPDLDRIGEIIRLGIPAAMQIAFEIGVFAATATLIGRLGATPLAAHQIALNAASVSYMVPLGIGAAAAVRVGQALGRGDPAAANRAGWTGMLFGAGFMACCGLLFWLAPGVIILMYTSDAEVMRAGTTLLAVAAVFQLFDGIQTVATGALRGAGNTRTAMLCHLIFYWAVGLPVGYYLCFGRNWGAAGLWTGLCLAIVLIGCALLFAWSRTPLSSPSSYRPH